jgi:hypothetical protein
MKWPGFLELRRKRHDLVQVARSHPLSSILGSAPPAAIEIPADFS